jgi:hypothetical protein
MKQGLMCKRMNDIFHFPLKKDVGEVLMVAARQVQWRRWLEELECVLGVTSCF